MPPKDSRDPTAAMARLTSMKKEVIYRFASRTAQGHVGVILQLLQTIVDEREICVGECKGDSFLAQVIAVLPHFCSYVDGERQLHGVEAVNCMVEAARAAHAKKCATLAHVTPLRVWRFLLSAEQQSEVDAIAATVHSSTSEGLKSVAPKGGRTAKQKAASSKGASDALEAAMAMFE